MEHNGISYTLVQTANPTGWKWTIELPGRRPKTGMSVHRRMAIRAAVAAIESAARKTKLAAPSALCQEPDIESCVKLDHREAVGSDR
jgi:hypothetical protein